MNAHFVTSRTPIVRDDRLRDLINKERLSSYTLALGAGAAVGLASYVSLQVACAGVLVATVVCLYVRSRMAGMVALWSLWFVIPMVRRLFALLEGSPAADPLSLAPFAATALIALIELTRTELDTRVKAVLILGVVGLLFGVPTGASEPLAMLFAFCAYASALAAVAIGYAHGPSLLRELSVHRVVVLVGAPLAAYGIAQYFLPLPQWDEVWQATVADDYGSIGSPEEGKVRVWSALNGPGTLGAVLALGIVLLLATPRLRRAESVTLALMTVCLALTFVRSAWVALVVGVIAYGLASRRSGRGGRRAAAFLGILALGVVGLQGTGSTGSAFSERVLSIGSPSEDVSAEARTSTTTDLAPSAAQKPFGNGLGSAGEAANLRGAGGLSDPDNGYLSILYQNGPIGLLLFCGVMLYCLGSAVALARRRRPPPVAAPLVGALTLFATIELFGDALYGVTGAAFWYLAGVVLRLRARTSQPDRHKAAPSMVAVGGSQKAAVPALSFPTSSRLG